MVKLLDKKFFLVDWRDWKKYLRAILFVRERSIFRRCKKLFGLKFFDLECLILDARNVGKNEKNYRLN